MIIVIDDTEKKIRVRIDSRAVEVAMLERDSYNVERYVFEYSYDLDGVTIFGCQPYDVEVIQEDEGEEG